MLQILPRDTALDPASDHKARPVGVGKHDQPPALGGPAQQGHLVPVLEDTETRRLQDQGIHHLGQRVFVIPALHHDSLPDVKQSPLLLSFACGPFSAPGPLPPRRP